MDEYEHEGPTDQEIEDTYSSAWKYVLNEVARAYFRTWLAAHDARVRRDVAREAFDGLVRDLAAAGEDAEAEEVRAYRDTHYPETED